MPRAPRCRLLLDPLLRPLRRNSSSQQGKQLRCTGSTVCTTAVTHSDPNTRSTHELSGRSVQGLCPSQLLAVVRGHMAFCPATVYSVVMNEVLLLGWLMLVWPCSWS